MRRLVPVLTGLLLGVGVGVLIADGRWWPVAFLPLFGVALFASLRLIVPEASRPAVAQVIALGFALHVALSVLLFTGSLAIGRGGYIPGDDGAYATLATHFARYVQGVVQPPWVPPHWAGEAYLFGTWVYLETAIFVLIGPEVLVPILLNGTLALVTSMLVFDMTRHLFDRRSAFVALVLVTFFPSLVAWSSLNLKDALALLLVAICLWSLVRFQQRPRPTPLVVAFLTLIAMDSLRHYLFVGLAVLIPLVVAITRWKVRAEHIRGTAATFAASALLLAASQAGIGLGPQLVSTFESVRQAMALSARTAYVEPPPLRVKEGDSFVVAGPPGVAPPTVVHVNPNARIVVVTAEATPSESPGTTFVRPGDIVVVGGAHITPQPNPPDLPLTDGSRTLSGPEQFGEVTRRTLLHLPVGIAFALAGPFPWLFERALDLLLIPDLILWYVVGVSSVLTMVRERARWRTLAVIGLVEVGILALLAVSEGNWGTMFRHRGMALPWAVILAAPTLVRSVGERWDRAVRTR